MKIYDLYDIPADAFESVGGKAKGLYELSQCGLTVAKGFVAVDIDSEVALQAVVDYYEGSGLETVAVRSSASSEDGEVYSSAGQYTTILGAQGKAQVKQGIKRCLESLTRDVAESYTEYFSDAKSDKMSVIVQEMVDADVSGVCFTQHGDDEGTVHIEAVEGLGENLVSGKMTAREYLIDKYNMQTQGDELLNADMLRKIAEEACLASERMGFALDTEWAVLDNELYWLQARPITVTKEIDAFELDSTCIGENDVVTTCNIGEMMPGAVTPLTMSTSMYAIDHGVRRLMYESGTSKSIEEYPPESCFPHVGGTMFLNLNTMKNIADYVAMSDDTNLEIALCGRVLEGLPEREKRKVSKLIRALNAIKYFKILFSTKKACRNIKQLAEGLDIPEGGTAKEQYDAIDANLYKNNDAFWYHYITSSQAGAMSAALYHTLVGEGETPEEANSIIAGVLENIENVESVDILKSLKKIAAEILKERPQAVGYDAEQLAEYLKVSEGQSAYMLEHFIKRHGHRAIREAEMMSKSWHMDDVSLSGFLKSIMAAGITENRPANVQEYINSILGRYKGGTGKALKFMIDQARKGVVNREFTKSYCIKLLDGFKVAYQRLGRLMLDEGMFPEEELVYFLKHDELGRLIDGERTLVKKAVARRRVFEEQKDLKFKEMNVGKPVPVKVDYSKLEASKVLSGSAISRGKVTGKARVISCVEDANKLEKGEIMVAAFTDIGWSPYYSVAGALVTEVGSVLSHGAVVAREYALPLVSNIAYATKLIKTGSVICVDGSKGEVAIIEAAQ